MSRCKTQLDRQQEKEFDTPEKKQAEIERRAHIVGWLPRRLFDGMKFRDKMTGIQSAVTAADKGVYVRDLRGVLDGHRVCPRGLLINGRRLANLF